MVSEKTRVARSFRAYWDQNRHDRAGTLSPAARNLSERMFFAGAAAVVGMFMQPSTDDGMYALLVDVMDETGERVEADA